MADIQNSIERLRRLLKRVNHPLIDTESLTRDDATELLRVLHFVLLDFSRPIAQLVIDRGFDLHGKSDLSFLTSVFRLLREEFRYFPALNAAQFLSKNYLEKKLSLVADVIEVLIGKHRELTRLERQAQLTWSRPKGTPATKSRVENHVVPPQPPPQQMDVLLRHLQRTTLSEADSKALATERSSALLITPEPRFSEEEFTRSDQQMMEPPLTRSVATQVDWKSEQIESFAEGKASELHAMEANTQRTLEALERVASQVAELGRSLSSRMDKIELRLQVIERTMTETQERRAKSSEGEPVDLQSHLTIERVARSPPTPAISWPPDPTILDRYKEGIRNSVL